MTAHAGARWRVGRSVGRTIYAQHGEHPSKGDPLIGVMDSPELATAVVEAHNATLPRPVPPAGAIPLFDAVTP